VDFRVIRGAPIPDTCNQRSEGGPVRIEEACRLLYVHFLYRAPEFQWCARRCSALKWLAGGSAVRAGGYFCCRHVGVKRRCAAACSSFPFHSVLREVATICVRTTIWLLEPRCGVYFGHGGSDIGLNVPARHMSVVDTLLMRRASRLLPDWCHLASRCDDMSPKVRHRVKFCTCFLSPALLLSMLEVAEEFLLW